MRAHPAIRFTVAVALAAAGFAAGAETFRNGTSFYGAPASETTAARVVTLGSAKHINVDYRTAVTFSSGSQRFTWMFDGLDNRAIELTKIAPPGFATQPLTIYVGPNPDSGS